MKQYKALYNGRKTKAHKIGGRWLVGGDVDTNGSLIMLPHLGRFKKYQDRMAWYSLNGCFLNFQDFATEDEASATLDQWVEQ